MTELQQEDSHGLEANDATALRANQESSHVNKSSGGEQNEVHDTLDSGTTSIKHSRKRSLDYTPFDPESIKSETQKRRVPGKLIDKFWQPLDEETQSALDKIIDIAVDKARDRYKGVSSALTPKITEANELLIYSWKLEDPRSFKSRLKQTKLPLKRSMHTTPSQNDENKYILNYDVLNWRKSFLETHLLAELKQLDELKKTFHKNNLSYQADLKYLEELKKSIKTNKEKMNQTLTDKKQEFELEAKDNTDKIGVIKPTINRFKPHEDDKIKELLSNISTDLLKITKHSQCLLDFNDRLQNFQSNLEML